MWKKCIKCGTIIPAEIDSRCELHPKRWHSGSTREWRKTRERILARDGFAAPFTYDRASAARGRTLLEIHHRDGGDVLLVPEEELRTVCRKHNPRGG